VVSRDRTDCQAAEPLGIFCRVTGQPATGRPYLSLTLVVAVIATPTDADAGTAWVSVDGTTGAAQFVMVRVAPAASCAATLIVSLREAVVKVPPTGTERL
jgi:hypothetical protein